MLMLIYKSCFPEPAIHFLFFPPKDSGKVNRKRKPHKKTCKTGKIIHY